MNKLLSIVLVAIFLLAGCTLWKKEPQKEKMFIPLREIDPSLRGLTIDESNDPASFSGDWMENEGKRLI